MSILRGEEMQNNYRFLKYFMGLIVIGLLIIFAQYFINGAGFNNSVGDISSFDTIEGDYRVHYIDNPFYDSEYMKSGSTYVATYVDYIDIDFNYHLGYSKNVDSLSNYVIDATIIASDPKTKDILWDSYRKELLKEEKEIKDEKDAFIQESIRIDYNEFNNFLKEYSNNNHINVDAYLSVKLNVKNKGLYEEKDLISNNVLELKIPLNKESFKIDVISENKEDSYHINDDNTNMRIKYLIIGGMIWVIIIGISAYLALSYRNDVIKEGKYHRQLKRILNTYDGIIVNVDKLPSLDKLNVAEVTEFEELVDAQNEVRSPINFKEDKRRGIAKFVLIKDDLAWVYILKEGDKRER